ncbi:hypothetical protein [Hufsiella ginkgonis]|uniref:Uncharacterized protein n=1 Tax=Hufsiella ginkgonis TaxID=2695274 RepID=A0A7K1XWD3_9SPHI|nr:hypothetical protein [Hufsiella ginkgonis]MXV15270.1 hypothetical protein [Hufsiella ginkgonis]
MQPALREIKKELVHLGREELATLCLRLARYKKDNKELLSFLLFNADDLPAYTTIVKESLAEEFTHLNR